MTYIEGKIKFAIVGCGHIGKRHAAMISGNKECELVALCDIKDKEALAIGGYSVPFFDKMETLLADGPPADVICICTPNGIHARQSLLALESRRHVVVEKPMALTKADCERIIFKALNVSRQVFCVMQNRYSPPAAWLRELIEHDILGDIQLVQANCYWNRDDRYYFKRMARTAACPGITECSLS